MPKVGAGSARRFRCEASSVVPSGPRGPKRWSTQTRGLRKKDIMTAVEAFVTRHPVPTYFALAFAISWAGVLSLSARRDPDHH